MSPKFSVAVFPLFMLAACSAPHAFSDTELEARRNEVRNRITVHDLITNPDFQYDHAAILRTAAYEMVKGMSASQAVAAFASDGATCTATTCVWVERTREPLHYLYLPSIRPPGPRRTNDHFRQVTIKAAVVTSPADITVQSWFKNVPDRE